MLGIPCVGLEWMRPGGRGRKRWGAASRLPSTTYTSRVGVAAAARNVPGGHWETGRQKAASAYSPSWHVGVSVAVGAGGDDKIRGDRGYGGTAEG